MLCTYGNVQHELPLNRSIKAEPKPHTVVEKPISKYEKLIGIPQKIRKGQRGTDKH